MWEEIKQRSLLNRISIMNWTELNWMTDSLLGEICHTKGRNATKVSAEQNTKQSEEILCLIWTGNSLWLLLLLSPPTCNQTHSQNICRMKEITKWRRMSRGRLKENTKPSQIEDVSVWRRSSGFYFEMRKCILGGNWLFFYRWDCLFKGGDDSGCVNNTGEPIRKQFIHTSHLLGNHKSPNILFVSTKLKSRTYTKTYFFM